ncbi:hypothetical protein ACLB2K_020977 [Fragaria x ananassa]
MEGNFIQELEGPEVSKSNVLPRRNSILVLCNANTSEGFNPSRDEYKDEDMMVHQYLPKGVDYYKMMRKSKFCLCPSGFEVPSPRVVEAIYTGSVPVLVSDHYVAPFCDVLNWKSFSVEVSVNDIPNLKRILMSISTSHYLRMQRRLIQVRKHFEFNSPPKRFDVFHMVLHSIWLRRLNARVHDGLLAAT